LKLVCNCLRDLALDRENIINRAIVVLRPDVSASAGVDQLGIQPNSASVPAHASFQNVRDTKGLTDLARVARATIWHDTRPANHLEIGDVGQLGQNVVLHAIGKEGVLFLLAQVFKWQHSDSGCYRLPD
jgi:hypothetical protein